MRNHSLKLMLYTAVVCLFVMGSLIVWPGGLVKVMAGQNNNKTKKESQTLVDAVAKKADKLLKKWEIANDSDPVDAVDEIFAHLSNPKEFSYARDTGKKDAFWSYRYAQQMLNKRHGSCYHYAAAFGCLVSRCTGLPVRVCMGKAAIFKKGHWQPHAWTEVRIGGEWYIYDTNAAAYSNMSGISFDGLKLNEAGKYYKASDKDTIHM